MSTRENIRLIARTPLCPILYGDVSVMTHICAGKILVQANIASVDGYVHLVHIFKRRPTWHGTSKNHLYIKIEEYARNEERLTDDKIQSFCFPSISRSKLRRYPFSC